MTSTKFTRDYGVLCTECVLSMRYHEDQWMRRQRERRLMRRNATASISMVDRINNLRRLACRQYVASEEAQQEAMGLAGEKGGMGITEHRKEHIGVELSGNESIWRELLKGSPHPFFGHDQFG